MNIDTDSLRLKSGYASIKERLIVFLFFNAACFASAAAPLTVPNIRITEIMNTPLGGDPYQFLELQNRGSSNADLSGDRFSGISYVFPTNSMVAPGAILLLIPNIDPPAFATRYPGVAISGKFSGHLAKHGERIALENRFAQTITSIDFQDTGFWPSATNADGFPLEIIDPDGDPNDPVNWRLGPLNGTPGQVPSPLPLASATLRLNEIFSENSNSPGWVELFNPTTGALDLTGWSLTDQTAHSQSFLFPSGTSVPAQGYLMIYFDAATATHGLHTGFQLQNAARTIGLFNASGMRTDALTFGPLPPGYSLSRLDTGQWQLSNPTSGMANSTAALGSPASVVINEWHAAGSGDPDWIELYNRDPENPVALQGLALQTSEDSFEIKSRLFIGPHGVERLLADKHGGPEHLDFKLPAAGSTIALVDSHGQLLDSIVFGPQSAGLSQGRLPDASSHFAFFLSPPIPAAIGSASGITANRHLMDLVATAPGSSGVRLQFNALAGRSYSLLYRLAAAEGAWNLLTNVDTLASNNVMDLPAALPGNAPQAFYRLITPRLPNPSDPVISGVVPAPDAADLAVTNRIVMSFRESIDPAALTNHFRLADDLDRTTPGHFQFSDDFRTAAFVPNVTLAHSTRYSATLTDGVRSAAGVPLASNRAWSFETTPAPALIEDRTVYQQDALAVAEVHLTLFPRPGGYTLADVNNDLDPYDDFKPQVNVLFQEGTFENTATQPNGAIEQRGQSVRFSGQKSYRVGLSKGSKRWRGMKTINLNKHPYDLTRVRNKLSFDFFKTIPNFTSLRTSFTHVFIDNTDYGLFTDIENPDGDFLKAHGLDPAGQLYKANFFEFYRYPNLLLPASDPSYDENAFNRILEPKANPQHEKLFAMLDDLNDPDVPINRVLDKYFNRQNYMTWLAVNILMANLDTASRNFLLYSPSGSSAWYFLPWDYDGAWDFYHQPDQLHVTPLARWQEGIANWWGTVLHQRFLSVPDNVVQLNTRIRELADSILTTNQISQYLNSYHDLVAPYIQQLPDSQQLPVSDTSNPKPEFDLEFFRLPGIIGQDLTNYFQTLPRPMPIFLGAPQPTGAGWIFNWQSSYSLAGAPLVYDFQISRSPAFGAGDIVAEKSGLATTIWTYADRLPSGTYFWRVIIRDATHPEANWQLPFDFDIDSVTGAVHHGMRRLVVP